MSSIHDIEASLQPLKDQLTTHSIYSKLNSKKNLLQFMSHHVYSVWDFMNLLKFLQCHITSVTVPWKPKNPALSRLINEIVLEEESDIINEKETSHFQFYANTLLDIDPSHTITTFLSDLKSAVNYKTLINKAYIPQPSKHFCKFTFECINHSLLAVLAAFTFGRETLLPSVFEQITKENQLKKDSQLTGFFDYLERHIELDGNRHSHLALDLVKLSCKNKEDWTTVSTFAKRALEARLSFWSSIENVL